MPVVNVVRITLILCFTAWCLIFPPRIWTYFLHLRSRQSISLQKTAKEKNEAPTGYGAFTDEGKLIHYVEQVIEGAKTGAFTYFAHPDLVCYRGSRQLYAEQMRRLCREANSCGLPLEINLLGVDESRHYPYEYFWELAAEEGCQVVLGWDAHAPEQLLKPEAEKRLREEVKRLGLNLLDTVTLRSIG